MPAAIAPALGPAAALNGTEAMRSGISLALIWRFL
jgi:hypothetical protein